MRCVAALMPFLLSLVAIGCGKAAAGAPKVMVFAAASLMASFTELASEFEKSNPETRIELHFAGTPQLVMQVREGAAADVFAAADEANMQRVVELGRAAAPVVFAQNRLTIVTAKGNPKGIRSLADLARTDLRVLLCGPEVPAGRYARTALAKAGAAAQSLSDEPNVKAVLSKVQLGEVDAGIVYVTDAAAAQQHVDAVAIPDQHNVIASYPIAVLDAGANRAGGESFVAFVSSAAGRHVLARHGFATR